MAALSGVQNKIASKVSGYNRKRKYDVFEKVINVTPETTILDVGYVDAECSENDNYLEKHYPYRRNITALGICEPKKFRENYPEIKTVVYDGNIFPFDDNSFDVVWSNAVLEHVGQRDKQSKFVSEMYRVSRKHVFMTTPNRKFPIEVHTRTPLLHYLSKKHFDSYLSFAGKKWATGDYMYLLTSKDIKGLLLENQINNYKIIKNYLFGFVLDFIIVMDK